MFVRDPQKWNQLFWFVYPGTPSLTTVSEYHWWVIARIKSPINLVSQKAFDCPISGFRISWSKPWDHTYSTHKIQSQLMHAHHQSERHILDFPCFESIGQAQQQQIRAHKYFKLHEKAHAHSEQDFCNEKSIAWEIYRTDVFIC